MVPFSFPDPIWNVYLKKSIIFNRPNPKFRAKLAITLGNDHVQPALWVLNAFALNLER
jgi:hypothetical protein